MRRMVTAFLGMAMSALVVVAAEPAMACRCEVSGPLDEVAGIEPRPPDTLAGPEPDTAVAASDDGLFLPAEWLIALGVGAIALGAGAVVWSRRAATRS